MSTKIFNAYRVCDNKIETVFKIKKELEPLYEKWVHENLDQFGHQSLNDIKGYMHKGYVFWDVVNRYLGYGQEAKKTFSTPINKLSEYDLIYVLEGFIKQNENGPLNFDASMGLIEHRGLIYVQFFGLPDRSDSAFGKYFKKLIKNRIIIDRHYQNQTDRPDDISDEDWEKRGDIWDEIYPGGWEGYSTPSQVGFWHEFFSRAIYILHSYAEKRDKA